jgi:hypothetical protein
VTQFGHMYSWSHRSPDSLESPALYFVGSVI